MNFMKVTCSNVIKDSFGNITQYVLRYRAGVYYKHNSESLKQLIQSGCLDVDNIALDSNGNILFSESSIERQKKGIYEKAVLLGVAPCLDKNGYVEAFPNHDQVWVTDETSKFENRDFHANTIVFEGVEELDTVFKTTITCDTAILVNRNVADLIINRNNLFIEIRAKKVELAYRTFDESMILDMLNIIMSEQDDVEHAFESVKIHFKKYDLSNGDILQCVINVLDTTLPNKLYNWNDVIQYLKFAYMVYLSVGADADIYMKLMKNIQDRYVGTESEEEIEVENKKRSDFKLIEAIKWFIGLK